MTEYAIQLAVLEFVRYQYPRVMWQSSFDGIYISGSDDGKAKGYAAKMQRLQQSDEAYPDLFFPEPRGVYNGLYIELKTSKDKYLTKAGELRQNQHIQDQWATILKLNERGYYAAFADYDEALHLIGWYFGEPE
jgi:hypothetical protein